MAIDPNTGLEEVTTQTTEQPTPTTFDQRIQQLGQSSANEDMFRSGVIDMRKELQNQYGDVFKNLQSKNVFVNQVLYKKPVGTTVDVGQGYKLRNAGRTDFDQAGRAYDQLELLDPQGNVIKSVKHTDSGLTRNELTSALSENLGYGFLGQQGLSARELADRAAQLYGNTSLATTRTIAGGEAPQMGNVAMQEAIRNRALTSGITEEQAAQEIAREQNTEAMRVDQKIAQQGQGVQFQTASAGQATPSPETQEPFAGAKRITSPEELAGLTEDQIIRDPNSDAIYLRSTVNADTKLPTPQEGATVINYQPNISAQQQAGIQNLVDSGRVFNETDAANFAYATGQTDAKKFVGLTGQEAVALTQIPAARNITEITAETPRYQLLDITRNIKDTNPTGMATTDFIDATFRSLHGRSAYKKELADFAKMTNADAYAAILAGAPGQKSFEDRTNSTLADLARETKSDDPRISFDEGSGSIVTGGARRSPGDALADAAGKLGDNTLTQLEGLLMKFYQDDLSYTQGKLAEADAERDKYKLEVDKLRTDNTLQKAAEKLFGDGSRVDLILDSLEQMRGLIKNETESLGLGMAKLGDQPIASSIILGQKRVLEEQGLARIGALTAAANAALNEGNLARNVANDIYGAIRDDRKNQIDALYTLLDLADKDKIRLEQDERDNIDAQITILQDANDRMASEKEDLQNLILDNPLIAAAAGVSLTDTLDEAIGKINSQALNKNSEVYKLLTASVKRTSGGGKATPTDSERNLEAYLIQYDDGSVGIDPLAYEKLITSDEGRKILEQAFSYADKLNSQIQQTPTDDRQAGDYGDVSIGEFQPQQSDRMQTFQTGIEKFAFPFVGAIQGAQESASKIWTWLNE